MYSCELKMIKNMFGYQRLTLTGFDSISIIFFTSGSGSSIFATCNGVSSFCEKTQRIKINSNNHSESKLYW